MNQSDEILIHKKAQMLSGTYKADAKWGSIQISLVAIPNYAGGKGCPDEILQLRVEFPAFGTNIILSAPILIEGEKAGISAAGVDVDKFCERSKTGEQNSYLKIPVIVIGGQVNKRIRPTTQAVQARFMTTQVPRRVIE